MKILIEFKKPEYISAGLIKDKLTVEVKNTKYFFSKETLKTIPLNSKDEIRAPKMMPNTKFTEVFVELSGDLTKVS